MKSSTRAIPVLALTVLALLMAAPLSSSALALDATAEFDSATQSFNYAVIDGGGPSDVYTIEYEVAGCTQLDGEPASITGPDGSASVGVKCVPDGSGCGYVELKVCKEGLGCFKTFPFNLKCLKDCIVVERPEGCVPSVSHWGLLALLFLLLVSGAYVIRRKRAIATR